MSKTQTAADLTKLLQDAKDVAAKDPRLVEVRKLTDAIVALQRAKDTTGLVELREKRDALKAQVFADVLALSVKRAAAVAAERHAAAAVLADALAEKSDEELTGALRAVTERRKELRLEKRALRIVLDSRARVARVKEQVSKMSAEEKADLLRELEAS